LFFWREGGEGDYSGSFSNGKVFMRPIVQPAKPKIVHHPERNLQPPPPSWEPGNEVDLQQTLSAVRNDGLCVSTKMARHEKL